MDTPLREGEVLAQKYRIDRVLGVGGMGVVAAAHHLELDDRVAIKFLLPETLENAEAVARFAREARAAVKIKSEHVARVSDVGKLENGAPYMVMEYLEGTDLSGWLSERGPLPIDQALDFILQASEAIAEAHALGIVHRDLKPANLFAIRRPDGTLCIKVLDFGISKTTGLGGSGGEGSMTKTSAMMGSPLYMSPEQIQSSRDVDARADIWAIGVILYELLSGKTPYSGENIAELVYTIISASPPPLRDSRPDVPPGLESVILRCLEKDRAKRFASVAEMASALLPFALRRSVASVDRITGVTFGRNPLSDSASVVSTPAPATNGQGGVAAAGTQASWGKTSSAKSSGPWLWALAAAIGVAALVGAFVATRSSSAAAGPATSETVPSVLLHLAPSGAGPRPEPSQLPSISVALSTSSAPTLASAAASASSWPTAAGRGKRMQPATPPPSPPAKPPSQPSAASDPWGGRH